MRYAIVYSALVAGASAHGVVTSVQGANGVVMPGLSVADGTPRDCSTNSCGSQADTSIIRDRDMSSGRGSALGRTQGNGPVDAAAVISAFMGMGGNAPKNNGAASSVGVEDDISSLGRAGRQRRQEQKRQQQQRPQMGRLMSGIMGLVGGGAGNTGILGVTGAGGQRNQYAMETMVSDMTGMGKQQGLPTADENNEISMVYRQINQDGAGPLTATIDPTSGGTDPSAFITARMTKDVPGLGFQGLSLATNTDYPIKVQMPEGTTCEGKVGGAENVCIVRVRNGAITGPFGGSGAFTQTPAARKRAIAYRLKKRFQINRDEEDPKEKAKADLAELEEEEQDEE